MFPGLGLHVSWVEASYSLGWGFMLPGLKLGSPMLFGSLA